MQKMIHWLLVFGFLSILIACSTPVDPTKQAPGFLPNYSLLKPIANTPEGTQMFTYMTPNVKRSDYHAAIIAPVTLYQTATESGVTAAQIEQARKNIESGVTQIVSKKIAITDKPGTGVARIYVGITGAILEGDSFKPRNLIPISAAIKLASMATNMDNKKPTLIVEIKMVDSQSGVLLKETVSIISGDKFRMSIHTADEFQKLAIEWVHQAMSYAESK